MKLLLSMNPYTDYLMLISPPEKIIQDISRYKRAAINKIGEFESMYSKAHISITHQMRCKPFLAEHLLFQMERKLNTVPATQLHINGFAYFDHGETTRTIYASVQNDPHTDAWFKQLKKGMGIKVKDFVPHITVAKKIPVTAFNKLWPYFEKSIYRETFCADSLTILERETYNEYAHWAVYKELFFCSNKSEVFSP